MSLAAPTPKQMSSSVWSDFFFSVAQQPNSCECRITVEVSRSHTHTLRHTYSVGLLRASDQLVAEAGTYTTYNQHNRPCPQRDSNSRSQQSRGDRPTLFLWRRTPQQILRTHRSLKAYCAILVIKMERKISGFFFIFPSNGVPVELN